jgi:hypothetical protein
VSHRAFLRVEDDRLADDATLLLRLGTDADVDQTIKASLGHYSSYASVLKQPSGTERARREGGL